MESKVNFLEKTVEATDRRLENLTYKVEKWERAVSQVSLMEESSVRGEDGEENEEEDGACVMDLLQDVTQVREDYEQLRTDIVEIQQLQRELSQCLRTQLHQVHARYGFLRSKLGPALPTGLLMNLHSHQPSPVRQTSGGCVSNNR